MIIGLSGYAGAGKDTVAEFLQPHGFERQAFADRMRAGLLALNPLVPTYDGAHARMQTLVAAYGWDRAKRTFPEVRALLQRFGTEAGRELHGEDVWVEALLRGYDPYAGDRWVITDVRFLNEACAVQDSGGEVWRVERPLTGPANDHPSERALDEFTFDRVLANNSTPQHLMTLVEKEMAR